MFDWLSSFFGETSGCNTKNTINYSKKPKALKCAAHSQYYWSDPYETHRLMQKEGYDVDFMVKLRNATSHFDNEPETKL
jgi:hypothetical protein